MNIFDLAGVQLQREGKLECKDELLLMIDRAIKIRKWIDKHTQRTADKIMQGQQIYKYGNNIYTYAKP